MTEPTVFVFPGELISSKRGRKLRQFIAKSGKKCLAPVKGDVAEQDELRIRALIRSNPRFVMQWKLTMLNKHFPVSINFMIYRRTNGVFDYINIVQNLCDCMVKEGLLPDDSAKYLIPVFDPKGYQVDKANPRTEVTIL